MEMAVEWRIDLLVTSSRNQIDNLSLGGHEMLEMTDCYTARNYSVVARGQVWITWRRLCVTDQSEYFCWGKTKIHESLKNLKTKLPVRHKMLKDTASV